MAGFRKELVPVDSNGPVKANFRIIARQGTDIQCYVLEPKYDGSRYLLHLHRKGHHLTSRRASVKTGQYSDRIKQVPHLRHLKIPKQLEGTVLDGEVVSASFKLAGKGGVAGILNSHPKRAKQQQKKYGPLRYMAFSLKYFGRKNMQGKTALQRHKKLRKVVKLIYRYNPHIKEQKLIEVVPQVIPKNWQEITQTYKQCLEQGYEGIMIKDTREFEGRGMWKMKVFRDTCVIVSGYIEGTGKYKGLIGSIIFSAYDKKRKLVEIGKCSGMTDQERRKISRNRAHYLGRVLEVKSQEMGAAGRLRHSNFIRWRNDYPERKCTLEKVRQDLALI